MSYHSFDDFIQAIQLALINAQRSLDKRQARASLPGNVTGETGRERSTTRTFAIDPAGGKNGGGPITLPLSSLYHHQRHQVSMFALDFDCEFEEKRSNKFEPTYTLKIVEGDSQGARQRNRCRMQIAFRGANPPEGEILLDGKPFMKVPQYRPSETGGRPVTKIRRSLIGPLLRWWRRRKTVKKMVMTPEQAKRAKEIIEYLNDAKQRKM